MKFYDLSDDVTVPDRWHLGDITTPDGEEPRLRAGIRAPNHGGLSAFLDKPGRELDFSLTSFAVPVVRSPLANAMASIAGGNIQRLPVKIPGHDGFEVVNALQIIKCVDEDNSSFTKWTEKDHRPDLSGGYRMVTNLKILPEAIPADAHIFRIEGWLIALIVSETMKSVMEKAGSFGAKFVEVS